MRANLRKYKRLEKQNDALRKQNRELRNKIPLQEYASKIDQSLDRFENINDDLIQLYHELHRNRLRHRHIYWKYQLATLWIKLKHWCRSQPGKLTLHGSCDKQQM